MSRNYYVSGELTFKETGAKEFTLTELLLRYIAKREILPEGEDLPTDEELKDDYKEGEYDELLEDANSYLLREICEGFGETKKDGLMLEWCGAEWDSYVLDGIESLLPFAKENHLSVTGDLGIEFPDNGGRITHWIPKEDLSGFDRYEQDEYEIHIAPSKALLEELAKRGAGVSCVVEYSHFDETDVSVTLYPYTEAESGLKERYEAYMAEEEDCEPENIDRSNSFLEPDNGYGIIRFIRGGYVEFFLTGAKPGKKKGGELK